VLVEQQIDERLGNGDLCGREERQFRRQAKR